MGTAMKQAILPALLLALADISAAYAQSPDYDWQEYGGGDFGKAGALMLFFDSARRAADSIAIVPQDES